MWSTCSVDVCCVFDCCSKSLRGDWIGVKTEEDGLSGVNLWIEVGEQMCKKFACMGIVRERALDNGKGMESMVERFACMTCMSCGGGGWDVLICSKEASDTRACAGGRVECLWWVESGSFGGGWSIMGVWRWMCRKGCE